MIGRTAVLSFIAVSLLSCIIYLYAIVDNIRIKLSCYCIAGACSVIFILMAVATAYLINRMRKFKSMCEGEATTLGSEQKTLLCIFIVFELSFISRAIFDVVIVSQLESVLESGDQQAQFELFCEILVAFILIDGAPFLSLLFFHCKNFRDAEPVSDESSALQSRNASAQLSVSSTSNSGVMRLDGNGLLTCAEENPSLYVVIG